MPSIKAGNLEKGTYFLFRGVPCAVVKAEFYKPGKGGAVNRVRYKNLNTGAVQEFTFKSQEQVDLIEVSTTQMQFLYDDGSELVFMDPRTYEQVSLAKSLIGDKALLLTPDVMVYVLFYEEKAMSISLPPKVKLKVTEAVEAVAGNTVNSPKKLVTLETGYEVHVPLFIKQGETIIIDTETGLYVSRE
jgi:elongation factor P